MIYILMAEKLISTQQVTGTFELDSDLDIMTCIWLYPERTWPRKDYSHVIEEMFTADKTHGVNTAIVTDSELLFQAVRVLVKQGKINASDLQFMIHNADGSIDCPIIDQDGRFDYWPDFWNYHGNCLRVLIDFPDLNK